MSHSRQYPDAPGTPEHRLPGGNIGGAVRIGDTVRRPTGPWTPAVHALLGHLAGRLPHVPAVHGLDARGREVLDFLPGRVVDLNVEPLTLGQLASLVGWTKAFHAAVAGFRHPEPWRMFPVPAPTLIGHNDLAAYNTCFDGDELVGVFDWDLAGPTTPLLELAFIAWNGVPLWRDGDPAVAAERLRLIARRYGGFEPGQILDAVPGRIQLMVDQIPIAAAAGDPGMANLVAMGGPDQDKRTLAALADRIPAIHRRLGSNGCSAGAGPASAPNSVTWRRWPATSVRRGPTTH
jgi:hypothetical protein